MRGALSRCALAALAVLALAACAEGRLAIHAAKQIGNAAIPPEPQTSDRVKIGKPYQVAGVWYYPHDDPKYDETGLASWYGEPFHGRMTANGEIFDMNAVSAAHKTLPLPSFVRVTNLENGRSMVVRVNDRGPFVNGRIIDMSRRGAQLLGFHERGTARVRVTVVPGPDGVPVAPPPTSAPVQVAMAALPQTGVEAAALPPPSGVSAQPAEPLPDRRAPPLAAAAPREPAPAPAAQAAAAESIQVVPVTSTSLFVQAGAFLQYDNANRLSARLSPYGPSHVSTFNINGQEFFRVRIGPLQDEAAADAVLAQLIAQGHADARIVVD